MNFNIINTEAIYRHLLATSDAAEREAIFRSELIAPFNPMLQIFGDPVQMAKMWGIFTPEDYANGASQVIASMVERLAAHNVWKQTEQALYDARRAFEPFADRITLDQVTFALIITDPAKALPEMKGYGGFGGFPGYIMVTISDPNDYVLPRIKAATAHELFHNIDFSLEPFNPMMTTVGEYIIAEGLAEAFAAHLYGEDVVGYMVTDLNESEIEHARRVIGEALKVSGFDKIRGYVFGSRIAQRMGFDDVNVPDYAGYAIGYRVVQQYLKRTGKSVPETVFVSPAEIIEESGYFR